MAHAIGRDKRIGAKFLHAGPGFGGWCFPMDTRAFAATGRRFNVPQTLIEEVVAQRGAQAGDDRAHRSARHRLQAQCRRYPRSAGARYHPGDLEGEADRARA
ncbi:hypothetical protein [Phyllobacterium salinisoli]|uniref:hypothetical protein n=1 Tax=Phyllobacterium salinisoli TaxID=1899321 RepID=UPI003CCB6719